MQQRTDSNTSFYSWKIILLQILHITNNRQDDQTDLTEGKGKELHFQVICHQIGPRGQAMVDVCWAISMDHI